MGEESTSRVSWVGELRRVIPRYTRFGIIGLALLTFLGVFAGRFQISEIATHFTAIYLVFAILGFLVCAGFRSLKSAGAAAALVLWHAIAVVPWYFGGDGTATEANLSILCTNLLSVNARYDDFLDLVHREDPDIVFIQELHQAWAVGLRPLEATYPYFIKIPREDNFGIALYSRLPLIDARENDIAEAGVPGIRADVEVNGRTVTLLNLHTLPPVGSWYFEIRNRQFTKLADFAKRQEDLFLVAGDLNTAMWSPYYKRMERDSGLVNARKGFGVVATWPSFYPIFRIPIDHCLLSPEIEVVDLRRGPAIGSDHLPLIVEVYVPRRSERQKDGGGAGD